MKSKRAEGYVSTCVMIVMQKYLEYNLLRKNDLLHFDSWASTFGETVTAIELAPEGSGYRPKTRFAKFYNLPELMSLFKETADIQTADMLDLPVPKANYHNVLLKPSEQQKEMVQSLAKRAEKVRNKMVNSSEDNMLLITNDGRKLALDQRLINEMLPDSETGKVSACADNVFDIWQKTAEKRSTQMVFCDLSTPHGDGKFNVYDDLRDKLIAKGIPKEEIAYIHSANSEAQKKELFGKVRNGQVRVLISDELDNMICDCEDLSEEFEKLYFAKRILSVLENSDMPIRAAVGLLDNVFIVDALFEDKDEYIGESDTDTDIYNFVVEHGYRHYDEIVMPGELPETVFIRMARCMMKKGGFNYDE